MNQNNTIITSRTRQPLFGLIVAVLGCAIQVIAHAGFVHVIGTVVKVENSVLTVKTSKGIVDVRVSEKTEVTKGDQKAAISDLSPGTRVVVDIPADSKEKIAHSVKVGVSTPSGIQAHEAHQ
jgi:hypothetical protein